MKKNNPRGSKSNSRESKILLEILGGIEYG